MVVTGTNLSSEGLDPRRRRLLFRCWHRGIREMDLVLGRFADAQLPTLSDVALDELELRHRFVSPAPRLP
jgi:antitoxin CptB